VAQQIPQAKLVLVSALKPAPWNPRSINDPRFENLCLSLIADPDFLQLRPILATLDGTVFAGNVRLRAAQHLGWLEVPAILVDIPEELAKERAMRRTPSGVNGRRTTSRSCSPASESKEATSTCSASTTGTSATCSTGSRQTAVSPTRTTRRRCPKNPSPSPGDLYILVDHRLLCGGSTDPHDVTLVMDGEKARLLCTDPPYLVDYDGTKRLGGNEGADPLGPGWDEFQGEEPAVQFYLDYLAACLPHLDAKCPIYQWFGDMRTKEVFVAWRQAGLTMHQVIIWVKTRGLLSRRHFMWQHESCLYGWVGGRQPAAQATDK
jgi:hypothetical protein